MAFDYCKATRHYTAVFASSSTTTTLSLSSSNGNSNDKDNKIIDGKAIAATIRHEIQQKVQHLQETRNITPGLAVLLVGTRRDSQTYVNMKKKACAQAGILSVGYDFDDTVSQDELIQTIHTLNADNTIHGILVQLPLPMHIDQDVVLETIHPTKDVDGLHSVNVAKLQLYNNTSGGDGKTAADITQEAPFSIPCTPLGCLVLLDRTGIQLQGQHCVVLGRSVLVGLPMARLLLGRDATVTVVHSKSRNIPQLLQQADVVIAAVGKAGLVQGDWLKPGAVVIDVGINSVDVVPDRPGGKTYKLVGDVDYDQAVQVCSKITPVPGGVGPMTIAMLLRNTVAACERAHEKRK